MGYAGSAEQLNDEDEANVRAQCALMGLDADALLEASDLERLAPEDSAYPLWRCHRHAAAVFAACQTQWVLHVGFGGAFYSGLSYPGVQTQMQTLVPRKKHRDAWEQLRVMEREGLRIKNERLT